MRNQLEIVDFESKLGVGADLDFAKYNGLVEIGQVQQVDRLRSLEENLLSVVTADQDSFDYISRCVKGGRTAPRVNDRKRSRGEYDGHYLRSRNRVSPACLATTCSVR